MKQLSVKWTLKWHELDLVPGYYYAFCPSQPHWDALMKKIKMTEDYPGGLDASVTHFKKQSQDHHFSLVTVKGGKWTRQQIAGLLIHEGMHVWREMRETIGEMNPSLEFEAYAIQHITRYLFADYERTRGKIFK